MGLSCGYKCLQLLLVIFNCGVFVCGIGLIAAGAVALNSVVNHWKDIEPPLQYLIITIIVLGCILFILGALGMFGACTKNVCLLTTYCVLLGLLIIGQIGAGIAAIIYKPKVKEHITDALKSIVSRYYSNEHFRKVLDEVQEKLKCCGAESPNDYHSRVPDSCKSSVGIYEKGCIDKVSELSKKHLNIVIICVFIFALLQMICLTFAVCVLIAIKQGRDD